MRNSFWIKLLLLLVFISGMLGLIYEVLWLNQMKLLLGNASYATAITLATFFAGLGLGSMFWGRQVAKTIQPLRLYAYVELGIALCAYVFILFFPILLHQYQATLFVKIFFSFLLLFPASFFMGGTMPIVSSFFITDRAEFGKKFGFLYALNTLGGVIGVFLAGFHLPVIIGFDASYKYAISFNILIATVLIVLSYRQKMKNNNTPIRGYKDSMVNYLSNKRMTILVFLTGFITIGLEVLWTRMFSLVLVNDVYSFSIILIVFLLSIGCSGFVARRLGESYIRITSNILIIAGICTGISQLLLIIFTGTRVVSLYQGWFFYLIHAFLLAASVIFLPVISLSALLPYLMQFDSKKEFLSGEIVGKWFPINILGSVVGALVSGLIFIPYIGLTKSIALFAIVLLMTGFFIRNGFTFPVKRKELMTAFSCIVTFAFLPIFFNLSGHGKNSEVVKKTWEGSNGTVSVLTRKEESGIDDMYIRVNGFYNLGGLGGLPDERRMAHIPLFLHPSAQSVFFIGMGTGITAGAALFHQVENVTVTELMPEVITASREYFWDHVNGLYTSKRAHVVAEDGRNYLLGSMDRYDVIISDLFYPWNVGSGSLYSKEQFTLAKNHLTEAGIFVQWLPMHQLSEYEFGVIARTIIDVFPQVTLWRDNFYPEQPIVGLVAYVKPTILDPNLLVKNVQTLKGNEDELLDTLLSVRGESVFNYGGGMSSFRASLDQLTKVIPFTFYAGNMTESKDLFLRYPENTDDHPVIEFNAPKSAGDVRIGKTTWLTGETYRNLLEKVATKVSLENDPYLKNLSDNQKQYVEAGVSFEKFSVAFAKAEEKHDEKLLEESEHWFNDYLEKTGLKNVMPDT